jgi:inosine/xanthosine triphosphatase
MKIIVASTNPVKQEAVRAAFEQAFPPPLLVEGINAPSGVPDQPMTDEETLQGASNRAAFAKRAQPDADFWVGVEGGVESRGESMEAFGWMVVLGQSRQGQARSASFLLPDSIVQSLRRGGELGPAMDALFEEHNSKHKGGAVGLLTHSLVSRQALYEQPLILALIPFLHPDKY